MRANNIVAQLINQRFAGRIDQNPRVEERKQAFEKNKVHKLNRIYERNKAEREHNQAVVYQKRQL